MTELDRQENQELKEEKKDLQNKKAVKLELPNKLKKELQQKPLKVKSLLKVEEKEEDESIEVELALTVPNVTEGTEVEEISENQKKLRLAVKRSKNKLKKHLHDYQSAEAVAALGIDVKDVKQLHSASVKNKDNRSVRAKYCNSPNLLQLTTWLT